MTLGDAISTVINEVLLDSGPEGLAQICSALDLPTDDWVAGQDVAEYYRAKLIAFFEGLE